MIMYTGEIVSIYEKTFRFLNFHIKKGSLSAAPNPDKKG